MTIGRPAGQSLVAWLLIGACVLVFLVHLRMGWGALMHPLDPWAARLILWPAHSPSFRPWQYLSYGFEHGSLLHLGLNMLGLWYFGTAIESRFGRRTLLLVYFGSIALAAAVHQSAAPWLGRPVPLLGASGGVFGLLVACALRLPERGTPIPFPPWTAPSSVAVLLYVLLEVYPMLPRNVPLSGDLDGLLGQSAHLAHLGGMLGGWLFHRLSPDRLTSGESP